mmetsp:Transcript_1805/g.2471  ORF Transcript_1805/g.2471 Transcript_1805/m.2471 type:complete len:244 (-) Transcript_1805:633-1364(-)
MPASLRLAVAARMSADDSTPRAVSTASHPVLMGAPALLKASARAPFGVSSDMPINPDAAVVAGLAWGNGSPPARSGATGATSGMPILVRNSSLTTMVVPSDLTSTGSCCESLFAAFAEAAAATAAPIDQLAAEAPMPCVCVCVRTGATMPAAIACSTANADASASDVADARASLLSSPTVPAFEGLFSAAAMPQMSVAGRVWSDVPCVEVPALTSASMSKTPPSDCAPPFTPPGPGLSLRPAV